MLGSWSAQQTTSEREQQGPLSRPGHSVWTGFAARARAPAVRRDPARGPGRCWGHGPRSKPRLSGSSRVRSADPVTQVGPGLLSGRERWRLSVVRRQTRVKFITARALPDTRMRRRGARIYPCIPPTYVGTEACTTPHVIRGRARGHGGGGGNFAA